MRFLKVILVFLAGALALACNMSGSANTARVVTGTISVLDNSYWNSVKIGVFSGETLGAYPHLGIGYASPGTDVSTYRINYTETYSLTSHQIPPVSGSSYSISDTGSTSSAYSFELPSTLPQFQSTTNKEAYYYAAWYDANSDGNLSLIDGSLDGVGEEFNRCAVRTDGGTAAAIQCFWQSWDSNQNPTGNYKYHGYDGYANSYGQISDSSTGFNFTINKASGW